MMAVRVLTAIAFVVATTTTVVLAAVVVGFAARSGLVLSLIEWCPVVPLHHHVGVAEGWWQWCCSGWGCGGRVGC